MSSCQLRIGYMPVSRRCRGGNGGWASARLSRQDLRLSGAVHDFWVKGEFVKGPSPAGKNMSL